MITTILLNTIATDPWLITLALIWIIVVLHLPYRYERRRDTHGHEHGLWQSLMYTYKYGQNYERLNYTGLRRFQKVILDLLQEVWALLRGDVLRRIVNELRRRLGL